jgi:AbrB family transcriptional regulator (stage V sporulation protein T)
LYKLGLIPNTKGDPICTKKEFFIEMRATGIVRRIDDLGRVVIPKEIRRTMRIREGDPLEIYTEKDGEVIFKKYSPMGELSDFAGQICETMYKTTGKIAAVTDRDSVISLYGAPKRDLLDKSFSAELEQLMEGRQPYRWERGAKRLPLVEGVDSPWIAVAVPILSEGDVMGCVLFMTAEEATPFGDVELKLAATVSKFLGKQME